ncbi:MAG: AMP-binding protein, partial [Planctomycetota bacterium]
MSQAEPSSKPSSESSFVWQPSAERVQQSHLFAFMQRHNVADPQALQAKTTGDPAWFWDTMLREMGVVFDTPYGEVMDDSAGIERPRWCVGGRMNITQSLLDRWLTSETADKIAVAHEGEDGRTQHLSYRELHRRTLALAGNLKQQGIGPGDVVAVMMPMAPPCVISMLAVLRCGAIFLPLFSGYGTGAVVSRLQDSGAKAILFSGGFVRRGKTVSIAAVVKDALQQCPTCRPLVQENQLGEVQLGEFDFDAFIEGDGGNGNAEIVGADDTCMLIYTSGTTGRPKGAVHTHCGFPVKAAADMLHGFDVHEDDVVFWMTDMGWMMGPWLVFGSLMLGATMVTYDGSPDVPDHGRIWQLCQDHRVSLLGVSPTLIRALMGRGDEHVTKHDLSPLRSFGSTGEPWNEGPWRWLFDVVGKGQLPILNYSGGTEISGGILCGNVLTPMKPCAFSGPMPGMDVDVVNTAGESVR